MNGERLTLALHDRARTEGFDACGIAAAGPLERDGATLRDWLDHGRHAGMHWMADDPARRADPRRLLDGCKSVVVLALNYWPGESAAGEPAGRARVALYARGRDYHKVVSKKLKALAAWLDETAGATTRCFVDTGPVLERGWAERAGLGWIGKNANLLTREMGSWLMLGELLTTAELVPHSGPPEDYCGSCTACLEACPTVEPQTPALGRNGARSERTTGDERGQKQRACLSHGSHLVLGEVAGRLQPGSPTRKTR